MNRFFIAAAAGIATMGALMAVHAGAQPVAAPTAVITPVDRAAAPKLVSTTQDGKPILLKRMVVTATPL